MANSVRLTAVLPLLSLAYLCSLYYPGFLASLRTHLTCPHSRAFVLGFPYGWQAFSFCLSFKSLSKCYLFSDAPPPPRPPQPPHSTFSLCVSPAQLYHLPYFEKYFFSFPLKHKLHEGRDFGQYSSLITSLIF